MEVLTHNQAVTGAYAPVESPEFTGAPTAPTPPAGDNSTKIATTAFVKGAVDDATSVAQAAGVSGAWLPDGFTTSHSTRNNAQLFVMPARLLAGTLDRLHIDVRTAGSAGSVHRLGVYRQTPGAPIGTSSEPPLVEGTVMTETTGLKELAISLTVNALDIYLLVCAQQGAPATNASVAAAPSLSQIAGIPVIGGGFNNNLASISANVSVPGALPAAITSGPQFATTPLVQVRYA